MGPGINIAWKREQKRAMYKYWNLNRTCKQDYIDASSDELSIRYELFAEARDRNNVNKPRIDTFQWHTKSNDDIFPNKLTRDYVNALVTD